MLNIASWSIKASTPTGSKKKICQVCFTTAHLGVSVFSCICWGHDIQSIKIQQTSLEFKYNIALFCHYLSIKPFHLSKHISRDDLRQQHYLLKVVLLESLTNSGYLSLSKSLKIYVEAYQLQEVQRRFMALLD